MKIFSNLAVTLDGRIADALRPSEMLGTPEDRRVMSQLRAKADVIITGSATLKAHPRCYKARLQDLAPSARKTFKYAANAIITASGDLEDDYPFWDDPEVVRFVFTTKQGYAKCLRAAKERAFVVECGSGAEVDLALVLARLKKSGLSKVLVEGGGRTLYHFLKQNLLQEIYTTLTPIVMGGALNPLLVQGSESFLPWRRLKILSMKRVRDELFLHYQVKGATRV